jgi:hypothetical protein
MILDHVPMYCSEDFDIALLTANGRKETKGMVRPGYLV